MKVFIPVIVLLAEAVSSFINKSERKTPAVTAGVLYVSICKFGVLGLPLFELDVKPEGVDTKGDDGEQEPLDPVTEQLHGCTGEFQSVAIDHGVLGFPTVNHTDRPGETNAEGEGSDQGAEDLPADLLQQAAVKIGFFFHTITSQYISAGDGFIVEKNERVVNQRIKKRQRILPPLGGIFVGKF